MTAKRGANGRFEKSETSAGAVETRDSYVNTAANIGQGTSNMSSYGTYWFNPISRNRQLLAKMYRGDFIAQRVCDSVADDMFREGIKIKDASIQPDEMDMLYKSMTSLGVWSDLATSAKWGRLFGGALAVIVIEGQDLSTPLRLETIGKGAFKRIIPVDRWLLSTNINDLVTDPGDPDFGMPRFYYSPAQYEGLPAGNIHHSRVIRFIGHELPFIDRWAEQGWGISVIEPIKERLDAFNAVTLGISQLVFRSHYRILKTPGYNKAAQMGGAAILGLQKQVESMRLFQGIESITTIDAADSLEQLQVSFSALPEILQQFVLQIAGACSIPVTILMGDSPSGMNATGESDVRGYYDAIGKRQEAIRPQINKILHILHMSLLERPASAQMTFEWNPLWKVSDTEKADLGEKTTSTIVSAFQSGLVKKSTALRQLRDSSEITGLWGGITDDEIKDADEEPPAIGELGALGSEDDAASIAAALVGDPANDDDSELDQSGAPDSDERTGTMDGIADPSLVPATAYVRRRVYLPDAREIEAWAREAGFDDGQIVKAEDMHVTVLHSRQALPPGSVVPEEEGIRIEPDGERRLAMFGDNVVLLLTSDDLHARFMELRARGGGHAFQTYQPHVTIAKGCYPFDLPNGLEARQPFPRAILLEPEEVSEISEHKRFPVSFYDESGEQVRQKDLLPTVPISSKRTIPAYGQEDPAKIARNFGRPVAVNDDAGAAAPGPGATPDASPDASSSVYVVASSDPESGSVSVSSVHSDEADANTVATQSNAPATVHKLSCDGGSRPSHVSVVSSSIVGPLQAFRKHKKALATAQDMRRETGMDSEVTRHKVA